MARRRGLDPFDRSSMIKSAALHIAITVIAWASAAFGGPPEIEFITYEIEIVSPPPAEVSEEIVEATEELVVERPDPEPEPTPPEPEPEEIVPVEVEEDPDPVQDEPEPESETPVEAAEESVVAEAPVEPEEEVEESGEGIEVRMAGLQRDYPEYYENIIRQIQRCFRPSVGGRLQTSVFFYITRDGSVDGASIETSSGNRRFDFDAMGAVECAGRGRFGALPDDLPYDRFPIRFTFFPRGEDAAESAGSPWRDDGARVGTAPVGALNHLRAPTR